MRVRGERGATARLELSFEPAPPRRITRIAIEAADAREEEASALPPPPVQGTMAPDELSRALDAYLGRLADSDGFAGVVLVAREGAALYERGYGLANRESKTAITPATRFNLASIGKAFTKTAIAQLIAQGKLALSDTIGSLLPDYPNAEAKGATVAQLLGHQAGIADFFGPAFAQAPKERFSSLGREPGRFAGRPPPEFDLTSGLAVRADPVRIRQVIANLLTNADRHTPADGSVLVRSRARAAEVTVEIENSGSHLTGEQLARIFDRFYRTDPARQRATGGTGLGLVIVKSLVEAHSGRVWARSEEERVTVGFALPAAEDGSRPTG